MLKKLSVFVVVLAAALAPVSPAAAWQQVCMKLPLGKAAFSATLNVVHGFNPALGIPTAYRAHGQNYHHGLPGELGPFERPNPANGLITSNGYILANQSKCVDISEVPEGDYFIVYVDPSWNGNARLCATHPSNPHRWYAQTRRPYHTLWYEAWGAVWSPECEFKYESN